MGKLDPADKKFLDEIGALPAPGTSSPKSVPVNAPITKAASAALSIGAGNPETGTTGGEFTWRNEYKKNDVKWATNPLGTVVTTIATIPGTFKVNTVLRYSPRVGEFTTSLEAALRGVATHPATDLGITVLYEPKQKFKGKTRIDGTVHMRVGRVRNKAIKWFHKNEVDAAIADPNKIYSPDPFFKSKNDVGTWFAKNPSFGSHWPAATISINFKARKDRPTWKIPAGVNLTGKILPTTFIVEAYCRCGKPGKIVSLGAVKIQEWPVPNAGHKYAVDWQVKVWPAQVSSRLALMVQ